MGDRRKRATTVNLTDEQREKIEAWRTQRARGGEVPTFASATREVIDYGLAVVSVEPREGD